MKRSGLIYLGLILLLLGASTVAEAQRLNFGADFYNRYVWRGVDFGESLSIQPTLEFSAGAFTLGSWASYSIAADGSAANEHDLYFSAALGPVSIGVTDYYFPSPGGIQFWDYNGNGGAHLLEFNAGVEAGPISLSANVFFHNEVDADGDQANSMYFEIGVPFSVGDTDAGVAVGIVPDASDFYGTSTAGVVNVTVSASKEVKITDSFSLPINAAYILNPTPGIARSFLLFGFSL